MAKENVLTPSERKSLNEAAARFAKRNHSLHNERIRPDGVNIFDWLSSKENAKAFKEARKAMDFIGVSDG